MRSEEEIQLEGFSLLPEGNIRREEYTERPARRIQREVDAAAIFPSSFIENVVTVAGNGGGGIVMRP